MCDFSEYSFKQIGDTLNRYDDYYDEIVPFLIKGNRIYMLTINGEKPKRSKGLKLINDKKISRIQQKNKDSFKNNHIIIEDFFLD